MGFPILEQIAQAIATPWSGMYRAGGSSARSFPRRGREQRERAAGPVLAEVDKPNSSPNPPNSAGRRTALKEAMARCTRMCEPGG